MLAFAGTPAGAAGVSFIDSVGHSPGLRAMKNEKSTLSPRSMNRVEMVGSAGVSHSRQGIRSTKKLHNFEMSVLPRYESVFHQILASENSAAMVDPIPVSVPNMAVLVGSTFLVPVTVGDTTDEGIRAFQFDLLYDQTVIVPHASPIEDVGTISDEMAITINNTVPGILTVVFHSSVHRTGAGTLFNFRFTAVGADGQTSPLTWQNFFFNEGIPGSVMTNGSVGLGLLVDAPLVSNSPQVYTGAAIPIEVACASGGVATNITPSSAINVGSHAVTANCPGGGGYSATTGASAGNFQITPVQVIATFTADDKPYDGNAGATVHTCVLTGVIGSDVVTCTAASPGTFDNENVGTNKTVTANITLGGADAGNYSVAPTATALADITVVLLTATFTADDKPYDGNTDAVVHTCVVSGVVGPEIVTCTAASPGTFDDENVGIGKTVTANITLGGADAGNYTVAPAATALADITAAPLTATFTADDKVYDGNTDAVVHTCVLTGIVGSDDVTCTAASPGTFDNENVGIDETVTANITLGGADAGNYTVAPTATALADITAALLTAAFTADDKPYDGNAGATVHTCVLTGVIGSDVVTCTAGSPGTFDNKNVGTNKTVTADITLGGANAGNYTVAPTAMALADISALLVTAAFTADDKPYDGNTDAVVHTCILTGVIGSDVVTCTAASPGTFDDENVGIDKTVTANITLGGADAGNYAVAPTATALADITLAPDTPSVSNSPQFFTGSAIPIEVTCASGGLATDVSPASETNINVYPVTASCPGGGNYSATTSLPAGDFEIVPPPPCVAPPADMEAWYAAENNANDIMGVPPHNGSFNGSYAAGKVGQSFSFDGVDDTVEIPDAPELNPTAEISLDAWVYVTGGQGQHRDIISKDGEASDRQFLLTASDVNKYRAHIGVPSGLEYVDGSTTVQLNTWTHLAMTYDGSTLKLYVNGELDGSLSVTGAIITTTQPIRIGGGAPIGQSPFFFTGRIDEVEIFSRALLETEIKGIYDSDLTGKCRSDISITKSLDTPGPYVPGQSITYTIVVVNNGPKDATNVNITDTPDNLTITDVNGDCTVLPCAIPSLASGDDVTFTVTATIDDAGSFDNSATATADDFDPDTSNNTDNTGNGNTAIKADTTTQITDVTPSPSLVGESYTVSWVVTPVLPAVGTPTGTVTITDGTGGTCTAPVEAGSCSLTSTSVGIKNLVAAYSGDISFNPSSSAVVLHSVFIKISGNIVQAPPMTGLGGVIVYLDQSQNGINEVALGFTFSDSNGNYEFVGMFTGDLKVTPAGPIPGRSFDSLSRKFVNVTTNLSSVDFVAYDSWTDIPRKIKVLSQIAAPGALVEMPVTMDSQDNEISVTLSVDYDPDRHAGPPVIACGSGAGAACGLTLAYPYPGRVVVTVTPESGVFTGGTIEILRLTFQTLPTSDLETPVDVGAPTILLVVDTLGDPVLAALLRGFIIFEHGPEPAPSPTPNRINVALTENGGVASASSQLSPPATAIDGVKSWAVTGAWKDSTPDAFPDWLQVDFSGAKTIDEIFIYGVRDDYLTVPEPLHDLTSSIYSNVDFDVQYWNGGGWANVPGGVITGNNNVVRKLTFLPLTTTRIRVVVYHALANYSRIVELEAWGIDAGPVQVPSPSQTPTPSPTPTVAPTPDASPVPSPTPVNRTNVALGQNGGVASASSQLSLPATAIDGVKSWAVTGAWKDATPDVFPDWLQVDFNGSKTIDEIVVYGVRDDYLTIPDPLPTTPSSIYPNVDFDVQYWNGSSWVTVPGGSITGNNLVVRKLTFSPVTTTKIRVLVFSALQNYSRVVELEAWGVPAGSPPVPSPTPVASPTPTPTPVATPTPVPSPSPLVRTNHALSANGGSAVGSSELNPASAAIDGSRVWSIGGAWKDSNPGIFPDVLQVDFSSVKSIDEISIFAVLDDYLNTVPPSLTTTTSVYSLVSFEVQYWNGTSWVTVPNGIIVGNNKAWTQIVFSPISTSRIRVLVNSASQDGYTRIVELEAWGNGPPS